MDVARGFKARFSIKPAARVVPIMARRRGAVEMLERCPVFLGDFPLVDEDAGSAARLRIRLCASRLRRARIGVGAWIGGRARAGGSSVEPCGTKRNSCNSHHDHAKKKY